MCDVALLQLRGSLFALGREVLRRQISGTIDYKKHSMSFWGLLFAFTCRCLETTVYPAKNKLLLPYSSVFFSVMTHEVILAAESNSSVMDFSGVGGCEQAISTLALG
jgi:hypothetical protein